MQNLIKKAETLVEALPYIQKLNKKIIVIKYGGNAMQSEELKHSVMEDITLLKFVGAYPIVVHGGGPDISAALKTYNIESNFINGLRVTDAETVKIAQQVLVGKTNKEIVSMIESVGGKAIGLSGIDGHLLECEKMHTEVEGEQVDIGFVGNVINVNNKLIKLVSEDEYIPVIAPIGVDNSGQSYNINADHAASAIAVATKAEKLIYLTDVEGVLDSKGNVISEISKQEIYEKIEDGSISGGMIPKVLSCTGAIDQGVSRVHIIDGRVPHCLLLEIFSNNAGVGTMITP